MIPMALFQKITIQQRQHKIKTYQPHKVKPAIFFLKFKKWFLIVKILYDLFTLATNLGLRLNLITGISMKVKVMISVWYLINKSHRLTATKSHSQLKEYQLYNLHYVVYLIIVAPDTTKPSINTTTASKPSKCRLIYFFHFSVCQYRDNASFSYASQKPFCRLLTKMKAMFVQHVRI